MAWTNIKDLLAAVPATMPSARGSADIQPLPNWEGMERLIRQRQNSIVTLQAEIHRAEQSKTDSMREHDEAIAALEAKIGELTEEMVQVQERVAERVRNLGIRAEVIK